MADTALVDEQAVVTALRVHGVVTLAAVFPLVCPDCRDTDGFLLLAREDYAIAACRCGALLRHSTLTEQCLLDHLDNPARFTAPARVDASWPDEHGVFGEHPQAPALAAELPTVWADARHANLI